MKPNLRLDMSILRVVPEIKKPIIVELNRGRFQFAVIAADVPPPQVNRAFVLTQIIAIYRFVNTELTNFLRCHALACVGMFMHARARHRSFQV
jgi:hypothetical protein